MPTTSYRIILDEVTTDIDGAGIFKDINKSGVTFWYSQQELADLKAALKNIRLFDETSKNNQKMNILLKNCIDRAFIKVGFVEKELLLRSGFVDTNKVAGEEEQAYALGLRKTKDGASPSKPSDDDLECYMSGKKLDHKKLQDAFKKRD